MLKLCVFCAVPIARDFEQDFTFTNDKFLEGLSVLCQVLEVGYGEFSGVGGWRPFGVDNFVSLVCYGKCYTILEELVALHRLIKETQVSLKENVKKIKDFVVESEKEVQDSNLEFTIKACLNLRQRILQSSHAGDKRAPKPAVKSIILPSSSTRSLASTLKLPTAFVKLERLPLPHPSQKAKVSSPVPNQQERSENEGEDDLGSCSSPSPASSPPLSPSRGPHKNKDDADYLPTLRGRSRPRWNPPAKVEKISRKRRRPAKNKGTEEDELGGDNSTLETDNYKSVKRSRNADGEDGDRKQPEPIPNPTKDPTTSTESLQFPLPKKRAGRPPEPGRLRYRVLNQETRLIKPIYVLNPSKNLLMFHNVPFQKIHSSLQCLHPHCTHIEPLPGYFADQLAFKNIRLHVYHQHRNPLRSLRDPESKPVFFCHQCDAKLDSRSGLLDHRKSRHLKSFRTKPKVLCEVCGEIIPHNKATRHKVAHKNLQEKEAARDKNFTDKPPKPLTFPCDQCSKIFQTVTSLRLHKVSHIPVEIRKQFMCDLCGAKYTSRSAVEEHKRRVHLKEPISGPLRCHICTKQFHHKERYEQHVRSHTGDKPYQCVHCGKRFNGRKNLETHEKLHFDNSVTCEYCSQVYKTERYLKRHHRKHHPEMVKPDPSKMRVYSEDNHQFIGPKQMYPCEPCKHVFVYKSILISHLKRMHMDRFTENQEFPVMWTIEDHYGSKK